MSDINPAEEAFVKAFILPNKRERWQTFLPTAKLRGKRLGQLSGKIRDDFDPRFVYSKDAPPAAIAATVQTLLADWKKTNPERLCHVIANSSPRDGQTMPLAEAEADESLTFGSIILIIPNRLAYYQTDRQPDKTNWYILVRT